MSVLQASWSPRLLHVAADVRDGSHVGHAYSCLGSYTHALAAKIETPSKVFLFAACQHHNPPQNTIYCTTTPTTPPPLLAHQHVAGQALASSLPSILWQQQAARAHGGIRVVSAVEALWTGDAHIRAIIGAAGVEGCIAGHLPLAGAHYRGVEVGRGEGGRQLGMLARAAVDKV